MKGLSLKIDINENAFCLFIIVVRKLSKSTLAYISRSHIQAVELPRPVFKLGSQDGESEFYKISTTGLLVTHQMLAPWCCMNSGGAILHLLGELDSESGDNCTKSKFSTHDNKH